MTIGSKDGFILAGAITSTVLDLFPSALPAGRSRHQFGHGPFARLKMPPLPNSPGVYLWSLGDAIVYVGQTQSSLAIRLGPRGYSTISNYKTFARQPGRRNGGQETNCRINSLANEALSSGHQLCIWYQCTPKEHAPTLEAQWMATYGLPIWNRRKEEERNEAREQFEG